MRPIFTVHAGEYLVASKIEKMFPSARIWIPSKDDGIDLLVTPRNCGKSLSLQVKFSKDYMGTDVRADFASGIKSGGWWTFNMKKIEESPADYWILVTYSFHSRDQDFIIVRPASLAKMYRALGQGDRINSYVWVTKMGQCWETRGLSINEKCEVAQGTFSDVRRNMTSYLNDWSMIDRLLR